MDPTKDDDGTPGWDAINAALAALYPGQEPTHYGTALPYTLGGNDPLDGISVYRADVPRPHWHYVTYGFSELYDKQSDDAVDSGYGFELTFRLAVDDDAASPPTWPMNLLQNLARYVFATGNVFEAGHHMDANGPIALDTDTCLRHVAFLPDPQLPARDTANGRLVFLQVIGVSDAEMAAIKRWSTDGVLHALAPRMPLWITDLHRPSLLDDADLARQVEAGSARDGSSTALLFVETLAWREEDDSTVLVLGAGQVPSLLDLLPLRLRYGHPLTVIGGDREWTFQPGERDALRRGEGGMTCTLTPASLDALLRDVRAQRGRYPLPGTGLVVEVVPTALRDAQDNVVREIG
ncbi:MULTISPECIES: suppressor of fused domain protein [Stenotrophomonas]|uniref:Suppressor of fused domain protein n=1 Tax=Stenotrophomonas maltophilia TaxID=40324 RepID=A0A4V3RIU5_STEMA|nr:MULTISPECIES: suppressor of fused domain protein [Stenotrophomonas]TGY33360.1 suppressor of fused domain protein [Stenotrophomonas maltophilia]